MEQNNLADTRLESMTDSTFESNGIHLIASVTKRSFTVELVCTWSFGKVIKKKKIIIIKWRIKESC